MMGKIDGIPYTFSHLMYYFLPFYRRSAYMRITYFMGKTTNYAFTQIPFLGNFRYTRNVTRTYGLGFQNDKK